MDQNENSCVTKQVFLSNSNDPYRNLAMEEFLLDNFSGEAALLFLYTNASSVVIGKHQNPWLEISLKELDSRQIPLVRRISGGGTVYHDLGNLNFSFIGKKAGFDRKKNLELVARAVSMLGVAAVVTDNYDLYAAGKKISGNAFCFRRDKVLHHGTLLIDADLDGLRLLLNPPEQGISTHAVRSRPAETANL
ncbi:MAG: lipoate--protein ligase family protein, partial [Spirochaetales bacterium]|nr:lipoate--protein ligase family protein [Spirochaetales bacterium]